MDKNKWIEQFLLISARYLALAPRVGEAALAVRAAIAARALTAQEPRRQGCCA